MKICIARFSVDKESKCVEANAVSGAKRSPAGIMPGYLFLLFTP